MSSIKLTADSGGGTFEIKAPSSSSNTRVLTLPDTGNITLPNTNGITMADQWRLHTSYTANGAAALLANWERVDNTNWSGIGTGMTESSGIFSFPSTGIYYIEFHGRGTANGGARQYTGIYIQTGVSGTYTNVADAYDSASANAYYFDTVTSTYFDVTNTTTHTVRLNVEASGSTLYSGNSNQNQTFVTFIKLGDT